MAGAIDLFAGAPSIHGSNLWKVDKDPLNQLSGGVEDVIGKQGEGAGNAILAPILSMIDSILGLPAGTTTDIWGKFNDITSMFSNVWMFLGELNPTSAFFDPAAAIETFITTMLYPANMLGPMNPLTLLLAPINIPGLDATKITSGLFPQSQIQNLESDLANLGNAIVSGDVAGIVEAITGIVDGTTDDLENWSDNLSTMLGLPPLNDAVFDGLGAAEQFILDMLQPANLLAPMNPLTLLIAPLNVPGLDATKIVSGIFPQSMLSITNIPATIVSGILTAANIPGLDATKIITGIFTTGQIPGLDAAKIISGAFSAAQIPLLDATKIATGILAIGQIPTTLLGAGNISDVQAIIDGIYQATHGGTTTGSLVSTVKPSLLNIPGGNIVSAILASIVPPLDATKITTGQFPQAMLNITSIAASIVTGVLGATQIPGLDATKIITGVFTSGQVPGLDAAKIISGIFTTGQIPSLDAAKIASGIFNVLRIPGLDATKITSGQFPQNMVVNLQSDLANLGAAIAAGDPAAIIEAITGIAGGTTADLENWSESLVSMLGLPDLNNAAFDAMAAVEQFIADRIDPLSLLAPMDPLTDLLFPYNVPLLDASKIATGIFSTGLIPNITKAMSSDMQSIVDNIYQATHGGLTTGNTVASIKASLLNIPGVNIVTTLLATVIPGLDATKITSGVFPQSMVNITSIAAGIVTGTLSAVNIPGLDTTKIVSGTFADSYVPGLTATRDAIFQAIYGGATTGTTVAQVKTALQNIPGGNIVSAILAAIVPPLDATKITTGTFTTGLIPGLDAAKIVSGIFTTGQIPGLDAAKIVSGIFTTGQIPSLDAAKISTGIFNVLRIPGLDATQVISGQFPQNMVVNLESDLANAVAVITAPIEAYLLQNVPVSSVGLFTPELLANPTYDSASSVSGGSSGWVFDSTVTHTAGGTGSAKVVANGSSKQLLSDPPILVSPNQVLNLSHWLMWSGVSATGLAFKLSVAAYNGTSISNTVDLATITSPAAASAWTQLAGSYTVPATGVDNIRLQLTVTSLVTAGSIWWDDGSAKKVQLLAQSWTTALPGDLANLLSGINARTLITDFTSLMSTLGSGTPTLAAITSRLTNISATGGFDAAQLLNTNNIPKLLSTSMFGVGGISDIGASVTQTWDAVAGAAAGLGTPAKITTRLTNINTAGLFNASSLTNMLGMPTIAAGSIPLLDASKVGTGIMNILQIPTSQLNRTTLTDLGDTLDEITNAFVGMGNAFTGTDPTQARQSMDSIYDEFLGLTQKMQDLRSSQIATNVSGTTVTVNFSEMPDGALPSSFTTTYSGTGTSTVGVTSGASGWRTKVNNGNRTAMIVYNQAPTNTDFQVVRGTLSGAPPSDGGGSKPRIAAIGRCNSASNPTTYVWARGYNDGFLTYKGDIGCTVNSVETVFASGIPLTWSMDISMIIGAQGNARRYQVFSGTTLVYDYTEAGTTSQLGAGFRYWGCRSELKTDSGSVIAPPSIVGTSVSDNQPPSVVGSTFRAYRASTGNVSFSGWNKTPSGFFDQQAHRSADMLWDGTNLTVGTEGTYLVNIRYNTQSIPQGDRADVSLFKNNGAVRKMGGAFADSYLAAEGNMFGSALIYCSVNDVLTPGYSVTATTTVTGEPAGTDTFFEVALVNRSLA